MTSKSRSGGKDRDEATHKPQEGTGDAGAPFDPGAEPGPDETAPGEPRPAPPPGVPMSSEEYERLKNRARTERTRPSVRPQTDPSGKPKGKSER
jgi:hypothetical protein